MKLARLEVGLRIGVLVASCCGAQAVFAQGSNPPNEETASYREADDSQEAQPQAQPTPENQGHLPSWRIAGETVTVVGQAPLREEELIGPYQQPRWTARRRFGETRVFVIPEGDVEMEYWLVPELRHHGQEAEVEQQIEVE